MEQRPPELPAIRGRGVITLRVRYAETDAMGVAYYGNFFMYFEDGRTAYLRERGLPYAEMEREGIFMPVAEAYCKYLAPARFEDELKIETTVTDAGRATVRFGYVVTKGDGVLANGYTVHAARTADGHPVRIPEAWARQLEFPPPGRRNE